MHDTDPVGKNSRYRVQTQQRKSASGEGNVSNHDLQRPVTDRQAS